MMMPMMHKVNGRRAKSTRRNRGVSQLCGHGVRLAPVVVISHAATTSAWAGLQWTCIDPASVAMGPEGSGACGEGQRWVAAGAASTWRQEWR